MRTRTILRIIIAVIAGVIGISFLSASNYSDAIARTLGTFMCISYLLYLLPTIWIYWSYQTNIQPHSVLRIITSVIALLPMFAMLYDTYLLFMGSRGISLTWGNWYNIFTERLDFPDIIAQPLMYIGTVVVITALVLTILAIFDNIYITIYGTTYLPRHRSIQIAGCIGYTILVIFAFVYLFIMPIMYLSIEIIPAITGTSPGPGP